MTRLEAAGLTKTYARRRRGTTAHRAVDDVSFTLDRQRTLAVVGESGAGKTTLGRLVLRLIEPESGSVRLDGVELTGLKRPALERFRAQMQMIFQDPFSSLDPRVSIGKSVTEPLKIHCGLNRSDRERAATHLLERVGLGAEYVERKPRELSGGQLQRVSIARAISVEPRLVVCDEPVAALDVLVRAQVLNLLLDLQDQTGVSYIFITHDLSTMRSFAHDVLVMRAGRVVERGPVKQIMDQPQHPYMAALVDAIPNPVPRAVRVVAADSSHGDGTGATSKQRAPSSVR